MQPVIKKEDSVTTLLKPTLYSIYDQDITRNEQDYKALSPGSHLNKGSNEESHTNRKLHVRFINVILATLVLSCLGMAFATLSGELYDNCSLKNGVLSLTLDKIAEWINQNIMVMPIFAVYGILGMLCGFVIPLVDLVFIPSHTTNDIHSILKCLNAMLGICLGVRHIEWLSSLQAAGAWGLLNIIMWLFFDGSTSIALMGSVISVISCTISYFSTSVIDYAQLLYIMDFYFFSFLIFGKIGRYLYGFC